MKKKTIQLHSHVSPALKCLEGRTCWLWDQGELTSQYFSNCAFQSLKSCILIFVQWCRKNELVAGPSGFVAGRSGCCRHGGRRSGRFYQGIPMIAIDFARRSDSMIFLNDLQYLPAGLLAPERIPRARKPERTLDAWRERPGV